jgi:hypothetical protein
MSTFAAESLAFAGSTGEERQTMKAGLDAAASAVSRVRRRAWPLLLAAALVWVVGAAHAAPSTKFYSVTIAPTTATAGTSTNYTVTLANDPSSTQTLGSANVSAPAGFTIASPANGATVTVTGSGGKTWNVKNASNTLEFRAATKNDALSPGQSVSVANVATTNPCAAGTHTWPTIAKQANNFSGPPGNDFIATGATTVEIVAGGPTTLAFGQQPTTTQKGTSISPAVTVTAVDACGNAASGSVDMTIGTPDPSGGTALLSGTSSPPIPAPPLGTVRQPLVSGVATFSDLSIDTSGVGYRLRASSGSATPVQSSTFNIVDFLCEAFPCELVDPDNITSVVVDNPSEPLPGPLGLSTSASGVPFGDGNCGAEQSLGRVVSVVPDESVSSDIILEVTITYGSQILPSGTGVPSFRFCANDGPGTDWYEVFDCPDNSPTIDDVKCISHRSASSGADLKITALMSWTDPDWGGFA